VPPQIGKDRPDDDHPNCNCQVAHKIFWRRGRDSNPRRPLSRSGFQDRRNRPLCHLSGWQGVRDLNPQPTVLETATLPIELTPYAVEFVSSFGQKGSRRNSISSSRIKKPPYATTSATRPAPIVRPPSRIAKRCPFSIATGFCNSISTETLSPGMTISTPCAKVNVPVTSLVRK
jgi:hypothetical protein